MVPVSRTEHATSLLSRKSFLPSSLWQREEAPATAGSTQTHGFTEYLRIVEYEQRGGDRAEYGEVLLKHLGKDLTERFGRGFGWRNLYHMRAFYRAYPQKLQTVSAKSLVHTRHGRP